jgi:YD repeat-containing protein
MGRLIGTTTSYSFLASRNFTNAYTYDAASNRAGFTDPENGSTTYSYDTLNRLTSLAPPSAFGSGSFGFAYDALSRRAQMTRGCRTLAGFMGAGVRSVLNELAPSDPHPGIQGHAVLFQMHEQIIIKEAINQLQPRDQPVLRQICPDHQGRHHQGPRDQ